jgi:hypothetical protein
VIAVRQEANLRVFAVEKSAGAYEKAKRGAWQLPVLSIPLTAAMSNSPAGGSRRKSGIEFKILCPVESYPPPFGSLYKTPHTPARGPMQGENCEGGWNDVTRRKCGPGRR